MSEGTVVEKKKFYKKWWFWVLVIIFIGVIGSSGDKPASTSTEKQTPVITEKEVEVVKVTAPQLAKAYKDNGVSADLTYKGKLLEISGTVKSIGRDILDDAYVTLSGDSNSFTDIQCMFSSENESALVSLKEGSKITVRGEVSSMLLNVLVKDCTVVANN